MSEIFSALWQIFNNKGAKNPFCAYSGIFEEKSAFENLIFIIFVHLIHFFSSVVNFGGGVLEIAFFVLKTRETFF